MGIIVTFNSITVNNQKKKINRSCDFTASSYPTATAYHWIPSMVGVEFWNNIYAKQGQFLYKIVRKYIMYVIPEEQFNNKVYYVNEI